jgi:hypothetical protein
MVIEIFEGSDLVGTGQIYALDPPMGVATGYFAPTSAYDRGRHANLVDGEYLGDRTSILTARLTDGGEIIACRAISIMDFPTLDECEIHLIGISAPPFKDLFGGHAQFKEFWS